MHQFGYILYFVRDCVGSAYMNYIVFIITDSESPISAENYRKSIKKNTLTVEIVTVVTLGCVLVLLIGIVYIILMLRQNRLQYLVQTVPSQKAHHSVNNAYDTGFSDEQPIVNSHF